MSEWGISVIIEWKNQNLAADERADAMLRALHKQWLTLREATAEGNHPNLRAAHVADCLEVLFIYDGEAARCSVERQLAASFETSRDNFRLQLIEGAGLSYYQMKHHGAEHASGDILIFLDSDVVPDPGWLPALLDAVLDSRVQVVCGNTYIEPDGLLGKAFALGWFFPLRALNSGLETGAKSYSNNLAFRASLYREYPFNEVPGTTRTAMVRLGATLAEQGISIYKCRHAQVSHPHPRGFMHFLQRGIVHGRDIYLKTNDAAGRHLAERRLGEVLREVWGRYCAGVRRTVNDYDRVDLKAPLIPLVVVVMTIYYGVFATGSLVTHIAPGPMSRVLQI